MGMVKVKSVTQHQENDESKNGTRAKKALIGR